jgi:hypothetical protein
MIGKLAVALAAPCLLSAAEPTQLAEPVYAAIPQVRQVLCANARGTAFRVGTGAYLTARHVSSGVNCTIDGEPIQVTWESVELDVAVLRTKVYGKPLPIDCSGYKDGEAYAGVGHARGLPVQRVVFVLFIADMDARLPRWMRFKTLFGERFIPGQSGGAVFGSSGAVVGIVNGYNRDIPLSYSTQLKDTPLCS